MNTELQMLLLATLLTVGLAFPPVIAVILNGGFRYAAGNRDQPLALPIWGERAVRTQRNMMENFLPFAVLVLVAHVAGVANEATAWGAVQFFWARVAHAVIYIAGIPYIRTVAFVVGLNGMLDIARELVSALSIGPAGA